MCILKKDLIKKANDYYKTVYNSKSGLKDYAGYGLAWSAFKLEEYQRAESLFEKLLKQKNCLLNIGLIYR